MKTHLLTFILSVSPVMITVGSGEEKKPDAPREERREAAERERRQVEDAAAAARKEIEGRLNAVMHEAAKLEVEGKKDEAEALRREAKEKAHAAMQEHERAIHARRESAERGREGADRRPDARPHAELEDKRIHVEQAIAHLREAGMMDAAENIARLAERMRAAARGEGEPRREGARREEGRREEPRREEPRREEGRREEPRREERRAEERRPQGDIEALRREIQELRQAVRQLSEKPGR